MIEKFLLLSEEFRSFGVQVAWLGFNRYELEIESNKRYEGRSSYTFLNKFKFAINTIISFSSRFLYLITLIGFLIFLIAFIFLIFKITYSWTKGDPVLAEVLFYQFTFHSD